MTRVLFTIHDWLWRYAHERKEAVEANLAVLYTPGPHVKSNTQDKLTCGLLAARAALLKYKKPGTVLANAPPPIEEITAWFKQTRREEWGMDAQRWDAVTTALVAGTPLELKRNSCICGLLC